MKTRKSINIYGNRRPKIGRLVANPIPQENIFWYDIFEPIVEAINKLFNGTSLTYKESDTIVFGPDNSINVNVNLFNRLNGNSLFQGRNIPFATINGEKIFDNDKNIIIESGGGNYIAGEHIIIENNVISADLSDYYNKSYISDKFNYLNNEIDLKQDNLIAGDNITIGKDNIISAINTTYNAGKNITILNGVISAIDTTYEGSDFDIKDLSDSTNLKSIWNGKQDKLIAGTNIIITGNTISAVQSAGFAVLIVDELPETGEQNTIYFLSNPTGIFPNIYNEYMYINNNWELIGNTAIDLYNYYTKTEIESIVDNIETKINSKQSILIPGNNIIINGNTISAIDTTYSDATQTEAGLMSSNDKIKLDGLNNYVLPIANSSVLGGIKIGNNLTIDINGVVSATDTTYSAGANIDITDNAIKAVGYRYNTTNGAFAEGDRNIVDGGTTYQKPYATGVMAHAEGSEGNAIGVNSHVEGRKAVTNGYASHAEGDGTETGGNYASATTNPKTPDSRTVVAGDYAHAEGNATIAYGSGSHSEGRLTFAQGVYSHAEGNETYAKWEYSHAEGNKTRAMGGASHAEGIETSTVGSGAHAEGSATIGNGYFSHAEGRLSTTRGVASHAEGYNTETGGSYTTNTKKEGNATDAGTYSHAEGNSTIANGVGAHSEGLKTLAKGTYSHAEGGLTIANGGNSHAEGRFTQTLQNAEHAQGSYNKSHTDDTSDGFGTNGSRTLHSIGIGTAEDARKNAVEVMQNGDAYLLGVGNYDGVHIKGENSATNDLQTLQEVISSLQWKIRILEPVKNNEIRYKTSDENVISPSMKKVYTTLTYNEKGIIVFDNDLTTIDDNSFNSITSLIEIELPEYEYFYRIGTTAFSKTKLKEIIIPKYITEIGDNAFAECNNLKTVKYNGTMEDWNNMSLGANIFINTQVTKIICIDGVVTI